MSTEPPKLTVRLPFITRDKMNAIGEALGKNQTESIITAVNLADLVLKEISSGKVLMIHDEKTGVSQRILLV